MSIPPQTGAPGRQRAATRLLLVDDEPGVRASMARVLERAGFAVRLADGAEQALAALRSEGVELVITDIIMPRQNGVELIKAVKREFPGTAVVAISGGGNFWPQGYKPEAITTSAYLAAAEQAGADGVLAKPFEIAELLAVVRGVLAKRETRA
jgi:two-component system, NtrC family, nitrogen regulation response regulator NtrX